MGTFAFDAVTSIERPLHLFFGGTFDPVHNAHLRVLWEVDHLLQPDAVHLVPNHIPPHKAEPQSTPTQRLAMLRLALEGESRWYVDTRELDRRRPSYTVETLEDIRSELGPEAGIAWLVGMDSFTTLDAWHRWRELGRLAHLVVVGRPGSQPPLSGEVAEWARERECDLHSLRQNPAGGVTQVACTQLNIASSVLRRDIRRGVAPRFLVPDPVCDYIARHNLYR